MERFTRFLHSYNRKIYDDEFVVFVKMDCINPRCKESYEQKFDLNQIDVLKQAMDNFYGLNVPRKVLLREIPEFGEEEIVSILDLERRCEEDIQTERRSEKFKIGLMSIPNILGDSR